jgi:hypothetical protein
MTFNTDKIAPHGYFPDYMKIAAAIGPSATVCEVGVFNGGSLAMWQHLFPFGLVIGVDHQPVSTWPEGTVRIDAEQDDPELQDKVRQHAPGGCNLIVDDASHIGHLTAATFTSLWPLVLPGGYYVIEDWADSWVFPSWPRWQDVRPELAGDELIDYVPSLIETLKDGAGEVTYTRLGLVIIRRAP